jgi:hypothetical protein
MMPHDQCQHSGCWLQSFCTISEITPPLFCLYQEVEVATLIGDDEGEDYLAVDRGVIIGMTHNSPDFSASGWSYTIKFESVGLAPSAPWVKFPFHDSLPESDLRPV